MYFSFYYILEEYGDAFTAFGEMIHWFAGQQIRNVAVRVLHSIYFR